FGINVEYRFALADASDVSVCEIEWSGPEAAIQVIAALQDIVATGPDHVALRIGIGKPVEGQNEGERAVALGQYFGPSAELPELLAPAYDAATPRREVIADLGFYEAKDFLATSPPPNAFQERSSYTAGPLADAGIAFAVDQVGRWPSGTG